MTKLLEKNNVDIRRAATKYKHTHKVVNIGNNTISSMIDMEPKDAIKLDTVPLDKTYAEEIVLPEDDLYRYL